MSEAYEKVFTVEQFWDCPRRGIANLRDRPHFYQSEWDVRTDDWALTFVLSTATDTVFGWALESWEIWRRWETAFLKGETPFETRPALSHERARKEELTRLLEACLMIDPKAFVRVHGEFRDRDDPDWSGFGAHPLEVRWIPVSSSEQSRPICLPPETATRTR
jgi:hypothetical protein